MLLKYDVTKRQEHELEIQRLRDDLEHEKFRVHQQTEDIIRSRLADLEGRVCQMEYPFFKCFFPYCKQIDVEESSFFFLWFILFSLRCSSLNVLFVANLLALVRFDPNSMMSDVEWRLRLQSTGYFHPIFMKKCFYSFTLFS